MTLKAMSMHAHPGSHKCKGKIERRVRLSGSPSILGDIHGAAPEDLQQMDGLRN